MMPTRNDNFWRNHNYNLRNLRAQSWILLIVVSMTAQTGCLRTSIYKFQSQPSEASVYYINGNDKTLVGQTPIDYTKAALPTDAPFTLLFEKSGYDPREITISPTDNSQTTISATLKISKDPFIDSGTKRIRDVLKQVFEIQELTARQRYVDALTSLNKLEEKEPNIAEIYSLKGSIYLILNDNAQAKAQWEKALQLDPSMDSLRTRIKALAAAVKGGNP